MDIAKIVEVLGGRYSGQPGIEIRSADSLERASSDSAVFCRNGSAAEKLAQIPAALLIVPEDFPKDALNGRNLLRHPDPELAFARLLPYLRDIADSTPGVHPTAVIETSAQVGPEARIGAGVYIGNNVRIGRGCRFGANVVIHDHSVLGDRVMIQSNTSVGNSGFGFLQREGRNIPFPQTGRIVIENDVSIGANCTLNRGTLDETRIGENTVIDDMVHIAHNVVIGKRTVIAGCSAIAGSTRIGSDCILAGRVGVSDHLEIADNVVLLAWSEVTKNIRKPGKYSGAPARPHMENLRHQARLRSSRR